MRMLSNKVNEIRRHPFASVILDEKLGRKSSNLSVLGLERLRSFVNAADDFPHSKKSITEAF